jgi:hypothetical protein
MSASVKTKLPYSFDTRSVLIRTLPDDFLGRRRRVSPQLSFAIAYVYLPRIYAKPMKKIDVTCFGEVKTRYREKCNSFATWHV